MVSDSEGAWVSRKYGEITIIRISRIIIETFIFLRQFETSWILQRNYGSWRPLTLKHTRRRICSTSEPYCEVLGFCCTSVGVDDLSNYYYCRFIGCRLSAWSGRCRC